MKAVLFVILLLSAAVAVAQPVDTLWTRAFGGAADEWIYGVCQDLNGDMVAVGKVQASASAPSDALVMKVTSEGALIRQATFGGASSDALYAVAATADGGFIATGLTQSSGAGGSDVYLEKFTATGASDWMQTFGGAANDVGYSVIQTADGGFAVAGSTQNSSSIMQMYLIRTNGDGQMLWSRGYGQSSTSLAMAICAVPDGGFLLAGYSLAGNYSGYVVRTNAAGDTLWTRSDGGGTKQYSAAAYTTGGGFILGGWQAVSGSFDYYLAKMNASGAMVWSRTSGGPGADYARSVLQTTDGGFLLAGYSNSFGAGNFDAYFVKFNSESDVSWTRSVGGTGDDKLMVAAPTIDGGCIGAGMTQSFGQGRPGYGDVYLMRLAAPIGIGGIIRNRSNQVRRDVHVAELGGTFSVRSDAQGRYFLPLQPGLHDLITFGGCTARDTLRQVTVIEDTVTVLNWLVDEPDGYVDQTSLNLVVHNHRADTAMVRIRNTSSGYLDYSMMPSPVAPLSDWLTISAMSGSIPPGGSREVAVRVIADTTDTGVWDYYGYVTVRLNVCPDSLFVVNVMAAVLDAGRPPSGLARDYALSAYPNPFNPVTTIRYSLTKTEYSTLSVYDIAGRKIRDLIAEVVSSGDHQITFDASNLPSGLYFVRLQTASANLTEKVMLLR